MSSLNLRLPDHLHAHVRDLAKREGVSINQLITLAVAEKISALDAEDYLKMRAARADEAAFENIMAAVPSTTPDSGDELPEHLKDLFEQ